MGQVVRESVCVCVCESVCVCVCVQAHGTLCNHLDYRPLRLLCPWNFRSKNTGVGCYLLLQRIFSIWDQTHIACVSCMVGSFFTAEPWGRWSHPTKAINWGWRRLNLALELAFLIWQKVIRTPNLTFSAGGHLPSRPFWETGQRLPGKTGGTQTPREPSGSGELLEAPGRGTFPSCLPGCIAAPRLVFLLSGNLFICAWKVFPCSKP